MHILTDWFPPSIKPKRIGIYLTSDGYGNWFQYWTGKRWKLRSDTVEGAYKLRDYQSQHQSVYWKGIKK